MIVYTGRKRYDVPGNLVEQLSSNVEQLRKCWRLPHAMTDKEVIARAVAAHVALVVQLNALKKGFRRAAKNINEAALQLNKVKVPKYPESGIVEAGIDLGSGESQSVEGQIKRGGLFLGPTDQVQV